MRTKALALLMMGAVLGAVPPVQAGPPEATISNFSFSPDPVTVPLGSTLKWTNADGVTHTVTADDGSFSSGNLARDATFTHTFNQPGPVAYHCAIHSSMHGTVQIEGATTTTAAPTTTTTAAATATTTARPSTTSTTQAPTSTTTAAAPVAATAPAPKPTAPKPAVSSTTRGTAAPAPTTTARPTTAAPPASAPADPPPSTTLPTQVALDSPSGRSGSGGAGAGALAAAIAGVLLLGGAAWGLRRRFSAG
jgi:plastocyanin